MIYKKYNGFKGFSLEAIAIIISLILGGWSVDVILGWFNKSIPFIWCMVIGLFTAKISFPIAVIGKILKAFGVF